MSPDPASRLLVGLPSRRYQFPLGYGPRSCSPPPCLTDRDAHWHRASGTCTPELPPELVTLPESRVSLRRRTGQMRRRVLPPQERTALWAAPKTWEGRTLTFPASVPPGGGVLAAGLPPPRRPRSRRPRPQIWRPRPQSTFGRDGKRSIRRRCAWASPWGASGVCSGAGTRVRERDGRRHRLGGTRHRSVRCG